MLYLLLDDQLPDDVEEMYWQSVYYRDQRLDSMLLGNHPFIDNSEIQEKETLSDLIVIAGTRTQEILSAKLGDDKDDWTWGKLHTV